MKERFEKEMSKLERELERERTTVLYTVNAHTDACYFVL